MNINRVQWVDQFNNPQTASYWTGNPYPQNGTQYILSADRPISSDESVVYVSPTYVYTSGSAFTIEVEAGVGVTNQGGVATGPLSGPYDFSYKDVNGITQTTSMASGSTAQFCVTEVSQSFLLEYTIFIPVAYTTYYNPFTINIVSSTCP